MHRLFDKYFVCGVLFFFCLALTAFDASAETRRALLIGINEYRTENFSSLRGAVNDVETMRQILVSRYVFPEANIRMLTDEAATRQGILDAFDTLVEQAAEGDMVYVHYSGHGSQVRDMNGDENDQFDETIVPHDGRTEGIADITDDDIGEFLRRLPAQNAIIVLDSCHSGTATRGGISTRSVPADMRLDLYQDTETDVAMRSIVPIDVPKQYVLMSGAASHQSALDGPVEGKYRGLFSYALAEALRQVDSQASPRELHSHVEQTFQRLSEKFGGMQLPDPQFESEDAMLDKPLFAARQGSTPSKAYLDVIVKSRTEGRLLRGASMDADVGSHWAVFPEGEAEFSLGKALTQAIVSKIVKGDSVFKYEGRKLKKGKKYRAIPLPKPAEPEPVLVRLDIDGDKIAGELRRDVKSRVENVQFVGSDEFARFVVTSVSDRLRVSDAAGFYVIDEFPASPVTAAASKLGELLKRSQSTVSLSKITNPASELLISATLADANSANAMRIRRAGETRTHQNSVMLQIEVNADAYVTVIDIDPEGSINVLFPNSYTNAGFLPEGFITAGTATRIPDSLEPGNKAGFHWDYSPPAGLDTIQVFASTDLDTANKIRRYIGSLTSVASRGAMRSVNPSERLYELQNELGAGIRTRAIRVVKDEPEDESKVTEPEVSTNLKDQPDWNSVSLSIRITE